MASRLLARRSCCCWWKVVRSSNILSFSSFVTCSGSGRKVLERTRHAASVDKFNRRPLWGWLNSIFNKFDKDRVKEVGPDRACAEWLLRCGAHVRRLNSERFQTDYNSLPAGNVASYKIEEINADNAAVMSVGFPHLEGLNHLKKIRFYNCVYLDDEALIELSRVKHTLEELEVGSCGVITDKGIASIAELELLKVLKLYDLPAVRDKRGCFEILKKALPQCDIQFPDAVPSTTKST